MAFYPGFVCLGNDVPPWLMDAKAPIDRQIEFIFMRYQEAGAIAITTFPTNAEMLAQRIIERGLDMLFIQRFGVFAEMFETSQEELILKAFPNAQIWSTYSAEEVGLIATRCIYEPKLHHIMAHKLGLDGSYLKPTREECFAEFIKAIQELTISDEARDKVKIKNLEQEKTQIEKLQKQIEELKGWVNYDIDKRIVLEGNFATGEIPFEVPDLPRYHMIRLQQKIIKDPVNYGHLRHLLK